MTVLSLNTPGLSTGRLFLSSVDGLDAQGKFERFFMYGARSFSIFRAADMRLMYDSGSEFERITADLRPGVFNSFVVPSQTLEFRFDRHSDGKVRVQSTDLKITG